MSITNGTRLGPYEVVSSLAAGGMGEVYRARDTRLDRIVAIKVLPESLAGDAERLQRFEQEARILSSLNHPNLLSIYDVGTQGEVHYLVSEFLEGGTLRECIDGHPMPRRRTTDYALQIANGLTAAHEKGIIHRDLKPDNVFVTKDGRVKILDFGLAKLTKVAAFAADAALTVTNPTAAGVVLGTVGYMAPEQVRGQSVDHRADIFSFGAILYEMVSGHRAFKGDSSIETMNAILKEEPPELTDSALNVSAGLERVVRRCLDKAPERRFQSASDLAFAIEALSSISSSKTPVPGLAPPSRLKSRAFWGGIGLVGCLAAAAFYFGIRVSNRPAPVFRQLAFGPGYINSARFTPDGANVFYGAAWNGKPLEIFSTRLDGVESRSVGLPPADVLSISDTGDMAILLGRHHFFQWMTTGTLGRVPISGGAPKALLENACDGDITSDGKDLAVVRCTPDEQILEFPIGKQIFRTSGWMDHPAIAPDGKAVAFLEHPIAGDNRGFVTVADISGNTKRLTEEWSGLSGLAWSRPTDEIWFSGTLFGESDSLRAVSRSGRQRVLLSSPVDLAILDVNAKGQALVLAARHTSEIATRRPGQQTDKVADFGTGAGSISGLSDDGTLLGVSYTGTGSGIDYLSYVARTDSPELTRLGEGDPSGVSPDGKWVISFRPSRPGKVILYPTGTGEPRTFDIGPISNSGIFGSWTHDSSRFVYTGSDSGKPVRAYMIDLKTEKGRAVTPEGTSDAIVSPDGRFVLARNSQGYALYPMDGGTPQPVVGMNDKDYPVQWDVPGTKLYVWDRRFPAHVTLLDPRTGVRKLWLETMPPDPAGLLYANFFITPDGKTYAYRYRRVLSTLYLAEGLR